MLLQQLSIWLLPVAQAVAQMKLDTGMLAVVVALVATVLQPGFLLQPELHIQ
jgi:hypothetical protein